MKPKAAKQPKQAKPGVRVKDLKPRKNASGGGFYRLLGDSDGDASKVNGSLADGRYTLTVLGSQ